MSRRKTIEDRILILEKFRDWAKPTLVAVAKELALAQPLINPNIYCKDDLDRKIIAYLIDKEAAGSTEIARALGLEKPKLVGRHTIGKRIKRLSLLSGRDGWHILEFHPECRDGKFRAWWLMLEDVDIEAFRKQFSEADLK